MIINRQKSQHSGPFSMKSALLGVVVFGLGLAATTTGRRPPPTKASPPLVSEGQVNGSVLPTANVPAVANLHPELRQALLNAADAAAEDGIEVRVNSGWRSRRYQSILLGDAIRFYGSKEEARRRVATPENSAHVHGAAIDVGPSEAAAWLRQNGAKFGLRQTYVNEGWHFELRRPEADSGLCPPMFQNASETR
ncbi:M15 family metallopeptidase [Microlunatus sp. GCM10028923]|uniref:M15 family metallopeptidase n=1 Tax=Microlunatus sp. GCM10028923 TaxID=3273400 RepID=UPI00360F0211